MNRGARHIVSPVVQQALRPAARRAPRHMPPARRQAPVVLETPLRRPPSQRAEVAIAAADEIFAGDLAGRAAVLGWLFARVRGYSRAGDDMVAHHARLRGEPYYEKWVELCGRLELFGRDR